MAPIPQKQEQFEEEGDDQRPFLSSSSTEDLPFEHDTRKHARPPVWKRYARLFIELILVLTVVAQFAHPYIQKVKAKMESPVPDFPMRKYKFVEQPRYLHEDMFKSKEDTLHTLHNWIELSSFGRGYVQIDNSTTYPDLGEPYLISNHGKQEPVYMMSVFHQLHCLSYLVEAYRTALSGEEVEQEVVHHSTHCFDMIRQAIMCNADTSLEGKSDAGPGWGGVHECKDYDAVLSWANDHTVVRWRDNMPDEATL